MDAIATGLATALLKTPDMSQFVNHLHKTGWFRWLSLFVVVYLACEDILETCIGVLVVAVALRIFQILQFTQSNVQ
jgi:hypothetical protein